MATLITERWTGRPLREYPCTTSRSLSYSDNRNQPPFASSTFKSLLRCQGADLSAHLNLVHDLLNIRDILRQFFGSLPLTGRLHRALQGQDTVLRAATDVLLIQSF